MTLFMRIAKHCLAPFVRRGVPVGERPGGFREDGWGHAGDGEENRIGGRNGERGAGRVGRSETARRNGGLGLQGLGGVRRRRLRSTKANRSGGKGRVSTRSANTAGISMFRLSSTRTKARSFSRAAASLEAARS